MNVKEVFTPINLAPFTDEEGYVWHHFEKAMVMFFPSIPVMIGVLDSPIFIKKFPIDDTHKFGDPDNPKLLRVECSSQNKRTLTMEELEQQFGKYICSFSKPNGSSLSKKDILAKNGGFKY